VDGEWLVPHFEKMLYDQSQLALLYLQSWQATGDAEYRRIAVETLDYVVREMTDPEGGFYSTQDADSEGEEGKFFLWSEAELAEVLAPEDARVAARYWGVAEGPNFEGRNILYVPREPDEVAAALGLSRAELDAALAPARRAPWAVPGGGAAGEAGPRREGAGRVERHDAAGLRRGLARLRAGRLPRGGRAERGVPAGGPAAPGPAPPDVEGRPGQAPRLPRGLRDGRRR